MATFTVNNTNDSGAGSLRQAIIDANASDTDDIIVFDPSLNSATIDLFSALPTITDGVTFDASNLYNGITIDAGLQDFQVLTIDGPDEFDVFIDRVRITGGNSSGPGGGISATNQNIFLNNSTVAGNFTNGEDSDGGGIFLLNGDLTVRNSTISGNSTIGFNSEGGGIHSVYGNVNITNSTISGNSTNALSSEGGGIFLNQGDLFVTNSTIFGNSLNEGNSRGGGINVNSGTGTINNTIIIGNTSRGNRPDDVSGSFVSNGHNILADLRNSIGFASQEEVGLPVERILDPNLQNNGGSTETHLLVGGSIAIDGGSNDVIVPHNSQWETDQRGLGLLEFFNNSGSQSIEISSDIDPAERENTRVFNDIIDIGAIEFTEVPESSGVMGIFTVFLLMVIFLRRKKNFNS